MAEYITKEQAYNSVDERIKELKADKEFNIVEEICISGVKKHINTIPTADVVEREKINKAIEDLKTEYCECKKPCSECIKNDHPYKCTCSIPLYEVLEFLNDRRNIGEELDEIYMDCYDYYF